MPFHSTVPPRRRIPSVVTLCLVTLAFTPAFAAVVACGEERFVSGAHTMPSHGEALAQCREEEMAMTHPIKGGYHPQRSCYDVAPSGQHGPWRYGRVGVDVIDKGSGEPYTFEALWMCKPMAEGSFDGPAFR